MSSVRGWYLGLLACAMSPLLFAGTHYRVQIPNQAMPYCEYMPFDYVDKKIVIHAVYNPIFVKQPVKLDVIRNDSKPLTGLQLWSPVGRVTATRLSDTRYQFELATLKKGQVYELRGRLKSPAKGGFKICVSALGQ